jgi:hypothetical protein
MTTDALIKFIFVAMIVVPLVLALLGWIGEKAEGPLEKLERRFPKVKGWER